MALTKRTRTLADVQTPSEIENLIAEIKKKKGDKTVVKGSEHRQPFRIRTGVFMLDLALCGGIPYNRTTMIHGKKHGGKTTLAMKIVGQCQLVLPDQRPVWLDVEDTYDSTWGGKLGVDNNSLVLAHPDTGEEAVDMAVAFIKTKETSLVVLDSLASLIPYKEADGSAEDEAIPGLQAKLITRYLRRATQAMMEERKRGHFVTMVVLNQHRVKIGGWSPTGEPRQLPGGQALGHFTSVEILVKNKENLDKNSGELTFNEHAFVIEKNKCNGGIRSGEYRMLRRADEDLGLVEADIDDASTLLTYAKKLGWFSASGRGGANLAFGESTYNWPNTDAAVKAMYEDRTIYEELRLQLIVNHAINLGMEQDFIDYLLGN